MNDTRVAKRSDLKELLERPGYKARLQQVLGERAPQFAAALIQVVGKSFQLSQCTPESVIGSAMTAAALDLSIDPNLGEAHLVPYGDKCQLQIGYIGFGQLAMRSGQYRHMGWDTVYEGELKEWNRLTGKLVIEKSSRKANGTVAGYAAMFELLNGFERASYWTKQEVEEHAQRYSQAYKKKKTDSPWFTNFDRMALKTVLKDLLKTWGPKSITMQKAVVEDNTVRATVDAEPEYPEAIEAEATTTTTDPHKPETTPLQQATAPKTVPKQDKKQPEAPRTSQEAPEGVSTPPTQSNAAVAPAALEAGAKSDPDHETTAPDEQAEAEAGLAPVAEQGMTGETDPALADKPTDSDAQKSIKLLGRQAGVTSAQITAFCREKKLCKEGQSWGDMATGKLVNLAKVFHEKLAEIKKL